MLWDSSAQFHTDLKDCIWVYVFVSFSCKKHVWEPKKLKLDNVHAYHLLFEETFYGNTCFISKYRGAPIFCPVNIYIYIPYIYIYPPVN